MSLVLSVAGAPDPTVTSLHDPLGKEHHSRTNFEESPYRRQSYLGGGRMSGRIGVARDARLVIGRKDRSVGVWRILEDEQGWEKVLEMELRVRLRLHQDVLVC
jgi:U3 small nucleolar RNA-associated protein 4